MLLRPNALPAAVALIATAALGLAIACNGDGGARSPTPSASPSPSPAAIQTEVPSSEPLPGAVQDLAVQPPQFTIFGAETGALTDTTPSLSHGDFNNDGTQDIIIGAPLADGPNGSRLDAGAAYIVYGGDLQGTLDLAQKPDIVIYGASEGDNLGFSVLGGDLNADRVDDIIVGAPGVTAGEDPRTDQGRAYVFFGARNLEETYDLAQDVFDFVVTGAEGFSRIGHALALGDVNGDGTGDLVLGAPFAGRPLGSPPGTPRTEVGEVYVVFGSPDLTGEVSIPSLEQDVTLSGSQGKPRHGQFGVAVAAADLNSDGIDDIIVGAHKSDGPDAQRPVGGAAYIFFGAKDISGRRSISDNQQDVTILGNTNSSFAFPITTGDFNGDGTPDAAFGARQAETDLGSAAGGVYILFGKSGLSGTLDLAAEPSNVAVLPSRAAELLPSSLAVADLNQDKVDDLIIGSSLADAPGRDGAGRVYLIFGGASLGGNIDLASGQQNLTVIGIEQSDRLGGSVSGADVTNDGVVDLLAIASSADGPDNSRPDSGEIYVIIPAQP